MKKIKIICTVTNDLNQDQRMHRICNSLVNAGYEVALIGRKKKNSRILPKKNFDQKRLNMFFQKGPLFYMEYNIRLFFFLLFSQFDIGNSIDLDTILAVRIVCFLKRKKMVFDAHEYFTETPEVMNRPFVKKMWSTIAKICIPGTHARYTVNNSLADLFDKIYNRSFEIIRNVAYLSEDSPPTNDPNPKILLYQGMLNQGRGLECCIEAMQWIEDAELWLIGEGDLSEELRELAKKSNAKERIKFLGWYNAEEMKSVTQKAYLGLNLLENKSLNYYYSLANKFFDYLQAGIPSVNMDFPEYEYIINQFQVGLLLEDLDSKLFAESVNDLLQDKEKYERMKEACNQARKVYNWKNEAQKLIDIYASLSS